MIRTALNSLFAIILVTLFALPGFANGIETCGDHHSTQEQQLAADHHTEHTEDESADHAHQGDCHCPLHHASCCHPNANFKKEIVVLSLLQTPVSPYLESIFAMKSEPALDGPFQPPRI